MHDARQKAERLLGQGRFAGEPKFITWSGGWSWAIPTGVPNADAAWEVVKFLTTTPGHLAAAAGTFDERSKNRQPYVPGMTGYIEADRMLAERYLRTLPEKYYKAQIFFADLLNVTRFRPITPLASELWEAQAKAAEEAVQHKASPAATSNAGLTRKEPWWSPQGESRALCVMDVPPSARRLLQRFKLFSKGLMWHRPQVPCLDFAIRCHKHVCGRGDHAVHKADLRARI